MPYNDDDKENNYNPKSTAMPIAVLLGVVLS